MSTETGLEPRYHVEKINDPTGKHADCRYFVLDPQHDPGARFALRAYKVWAARNGYDMLAADLDEWLDRLDLPTDSESEHITEDVDDAMIEVHCNTCDDGLAAPNTGIGRAMVAAWKTQHQHTPADSERAPR